MRQEPRPEDFRAAMRLGWKSHKPKPVVRTSRRSQPVFGVPPSKGHVGIAKKGVYSEWFLLIQRCNFICKACFGSQDVRFAPKAFLGSQELLF